MHHKGAVSEMVGIKRNTNEGGHYRQVGKHSC